jgi:hypothetical protein
VEVVRLIPVAASHSRTVQSQEPVTRRVPSGNNETDLTGPVYPLSTFWTTGQFIWHPDVSQRVLVNRTVFFAIAESRQARMGVLIHTDVVYCVK